MSKAITYIDDIDEEVNESYSDDDLFNINSWGADLTFRELITMYEEGELIKPELQRNYVWDKVEASRFVESILLGLPVPSIFLANLEDDTKLIIDGYQRIMTIHDYVKGSWSSDKKSFNLSNSEKINQRWRGKTFAELTESEKRKIRSTTIHAIMFQQIKPEESDTSLYQIFERINTGGRALLPQEIRNCVYQGEVNKLLFELNSNRYWRDLFGTEKIDPRMRDMEFILRFFALKANIYNDKVFQPKKNISLKKLLNNFMGSKENNKIESINKLRNDFEITVKFIHQNFGHNAFFNINKTSNRIRKRFYPTIFDSLMLGTFFVLENNATLIHNNELTTNLENKRLSLLQDEVYRNFITEGTMRTESIKGRVNKIMEDLYDISHISF